MSKLSAKELVGKKIIWTRTEPNKKTQRVLSRIADVRNLTISIEGYPGIYFFLNGVQRRPGDNVTSKIQLIDESYADQLELKWREDDKKRELINFITENKKYLIAMNLIDLENIAHDIEERMKRTILQ